MRAVQADRLTGNPGHDLNPRRRFDRVDQVDKEVGEDRLGRDRLQVLGEIDDTAAGDVPLAAEVLWPCADERLHALQDGLAVEVEPGGGPDQTSWPPAATNVEERQQARRAATARTGPPAC